MGLKSAVYNQSGFKSRADYDGACTVVHFLVQPNFQLVSSLLALFEARKVAQMTTEMIECYHLR